MQWINVKERLPGMRWVHVAYDGKTEAEQLCFNGERWLDDSARVWGTPTHWLDLGPIPDPPKVDPCREVYEKYLKEFGRTHTDEAWRITQIIWNAAKAHKE